MTAQTTTSAFQGWHVRAGWLHSPLYDSILLFGVLGIALGAGAVVTNHPNLFMLLFLADLWLLGYHHVVATFSKLAGTPQDRKENSFLIYIAPALVLGAVVAMIYFIGIWSVITTYFFLQWFHYVRQSYGISVFYGTRVPDLPRQNRWALKAVLWCVPIWGVLHRCAQGWDVFLFQDFWMPHVPWSLVSIAAIVSGIIIFLWVVSCLVAWKKGQLPLGQTLFIASHMLVFYLAYVFIKDINHGWLVVNIWHNAQYILFVWLYNTRRFSNYTGQGAKLLAWLSQPKPVRIILYFYVTLAISSVFYGVLSKGFSLVAQDNIVLLTMLYVLAFQTINFHHYLADGYIWKARKKQHRDVIGVESVV